MSVTSSQSINVSMWCDVVHFSVALLSKIMKCKRNAATDLCACPKHHIVMGFGLLVCVYSYAVVVSSLLVFIANMFVF